ncbi:hypothetical protein ABT084_21115 [Streptomyces sp. NPDC002138]|uniref:hypothetical protein n=1 Tax=Streptomyces sp. NPDC002138 TaxID=3154410 RepID=UPI0033298F5D
MHKTFVASAGVGDSTPSGYTINFSVQIDGGGVEEFTMGPGDGLKQLVMSLVVV